MLVNTLKTIPLFNMSSGLAPV